MEDGNTAGKKQLLVLLKVLAGFSGSKKMFTKEHGSDLLLHLSRQKQLNFGVTENGMKCVVVCSNPIGACVTKPNRRHSFVAVEDSFSHKWQYTNYCWSDLYYGQRWLQSLCWQLVPWIRFY